MCHADSVSPHLHEMNFVHQNPLQYLKATIMRRQILSYYLKQHYVGPEVLTAMTTKSVVFCVWNTIVKLFLKHPV
jgi:hypothetical protein